MRLSVEKQQRNGIVMMLLIILLLAVVLQAAHSETLLRIGVKQNVITEERQVSAANAALLDADKEKLHTQKLAIMIDPTDDFSVKLANNIQAALKDMQRDTEQVDITSSMTAFEPDRYAGIVVTTTMLNRIPNNEWIEPYVSEGGSMMFATVPTPDETFYRLYRKLGVDDVGEFRKAIGIKLKSDFILGGQGASFIDTTLENVSLFVVLNRNVNIHAVDQDDMPLLWENAYGKGKFVVFNGTIMQEKTSRGLAVQAAGLMTKVWAYPIINAKLMYIDDFPAPLPFGVNISLYKDYKRTLPRFFKEIWWPDMIRLASAYDLRYTGLVIQSYDDNVKPPFNSIANRDYSTLVTFGRELLKLGGEIGIHGYNHQSLTMDKKVSEFFGYNPWPSYDAMTQSIDEVLSYVRTAYPNMELHTYVPPSNTMSDQGRQALKQSWPDLRVISSVFAEDSSNRAYVQEYGIGDDGVIDIPRVTSGFFNTEFDRWMMINAASYLGIFSHFVHPDDVLDEKRSLSQSWNKLYDSFSHMMDEQQERYGWLQSMTASEAGQEVEKWSQSQIHLDYQDKGLYGYIDNFKGQMHLIVRSPYEIKSTDNCEARKLEEQAYLITVKGPVFSLQWKGGADS